MVEDRVDLRVKGLPLVHLESLKEAVTAMDAEVEDPRLAPRRGRYAIDTLRNERCFCDTSTEELDIAVIRNDGNVRLVVEISAGVFVYDECPESEFVVTWEKAGGRYAYTTIANLYAISNQVLHDYESAAAWLDWDWRKSRQYPGRRNVGS